MSLSLFVLGDTTLHHVQPPSIFVVYVAKKDSALMYQATLTLPIEMDLKNSCYLLQLSNNE